MRPATPRSANGAGGSGRWWTKLYRTLGLVDAAGAPRYTIHQLRHTRGAELVEQGHSLDIVQKVLGHRDPRSTQVYAELHPDQVQAALERNIKS